jgi:transcriptional regulator with XRE-family HTH domain
MKKRSDELIVGQRIRKLRKTQRVRQKTLAQMVGISTGALTNFEKGRRRISLDWLQKISEALASSAGKSWSSVHSSCWLRSVRWVRSVEVRELIYVSESSSPAKKSAVSCSVASSGPLMSTGDAGSPSAFIMEATR